MDTDLYIIQHEQKINGLLAAKKYSEAYDICKQLLFRFSEEKSILKLKKRIESEVTRENEQMIKVKLEEIKPLFKEKKYSEILKTLKDLLNISPNSEKIKKLYYDAQEKYQEQIKVLQQEFSKSQSERLNDLLNKAPNLLLENLFELEKGNPENQMVLELTTGFRDKLIAKKIEEKEELIYSDKFQDIRNFLEQLRKIDAKNQRISELEKLIQAREHQTQIVQKDEFIYAGEKHLDTLMKLKKYDKALKVGEELLSLDPDNKKVKKISKTAETRYFRQLRKQTIQEILKNNDNLKSEYKQSPNKFRTL